MDDQEIREATVRERETLAEWLATLDEPALATPSLCAGWDVRTVAAHLVAAVTVSLPTFLATALRSGGSFHRANDRLARRVAQRPITDLVRAYRANARRRLSNPGVGSYGPLTDVLVHAADMRQPLGLPYAPPLHVACEALGWATGGKAVGFVPRGRLDGLQLVATDADVVRGTGAEVRGRVADLLLAACGRRSVLGALEGPGVTVLGSRL